MTDKSVGKFAKFTDGIWREVTDGSPGVPLYAAPRKWDGLTNQERNHIWQDFIGWGDPSHDDENLMKAIEGKLKEKNT
jgi:hypothetical protein